MSKAASLRERLRALGAKAEGADMETRRECAARALVAITEWYSDQPGAISDADREIHLLLSQLALGLADLDRGIVVPLLMPGEGRPGRPRPHAREMFTHTLVAAIDYARRYDERGCPLSRRRSYRVAGGVVASAAGLDASTVVAAYQNHVYKQRLRADGSLRDDDLALTRMVLTADEYDRAITYLREHRI